MICPKCEAVMKIQDDEGVYEHWLCPVCGYTNGMPERDIEEESVNPSDTQAYQSELYTLYREQDEPAPDEY